MANIIFEKGDKVYFCKRNKFCYFPCFGVVKYGGRNSNLIKIESEDGAIITRRCVDCTKTRKAILGRCDKLNEQLIKQRAPK